MNNRDASLFAQTIDRFNHGIKELAESGNLPDVNRTVDGNLPEELWMLIVEQVCSRFRLASVSVRLKVVQAYERTVSPMSRTLRKYKAWGSEVYGELLASPFCILYPFD